MGFLHAYQAAPEEEVASPNKTKPIVISHSLGSMMIRALEKMA